MLYLGCDPGANGGVAVLDESGAVRHLYQLHGESPADIVDALWGVMLPAHAALEHVWTTGPKHGGDFKLGRSFGWLEAALAAARIPHQLVLPKKWQAEFGISYPAGSSSTARKQLTKARAQQLFPGVAITHATADALLLAEYCRRFYRRLGHGEEESRPGTHQGKRRGEAHDLEGLRANLGTQTQLRGDGARARAPRAEGRAGRAPRDGANPARAAR